MKKSRSLGAQRDNVLDHRSEPDISFAVDTAFMAIFAVVMAPLLILPSTLGLFVSDHALFCRHRTCSINESLSFLLKDATLDEQRPSWPARADLGDLVFEHAVEDAEEAQVELVLEEDAAAELPESQAEDERPSSGFVSLVGEIPN